MKQTITINELRLIAGKFIIQLDTENPIVLTSNKIDLEFYIAKRIRFITFGGDGIISSDLYGNSSTYTEENFVEMFNNYLGNSKGQRYHRLLYSKELDKVFDWIKKTNY